MSVKQRGENITVEREDSLYVVTDEATGITRKAETKASALTKLARALRLHTPPEAHHYND